MVPTLSAASPSNDAFTNATELVGDDVTFTGSLLGASIDNNFENGSIYNAEGDAAVWWTWMASGTQPVTLFAISHPVRIAWGDGLVVYDQEPVDSNYFPPGAMLGFVPLQTAGISPCFTFTAQAGRRYWFKWIGFSRQPITFRLVATNAPIILEQPASERITPGASVLFKVLAIGPRPFSYQWLFNGAELPGENLAMLSLTNVLPSLAGEYSVRVANSNAVLFSRVATLVVTNFEAPPEFVGLIREDSSTLRCSLSAEPGRKYRIESSTDLVAWSPEATFPIHPEQLSCTNLTSVLSTSNGLTLFALSNGVSQKFVRAVSYRPGDEICNLALKRMRFAKELWQRDFQPNTEYDTETQFSDLLPYYNMTLVDLASWKCPAGGYISVGRRRDLPQCSVHGNSLEEPR